MLHYCKTFRSLQRNKKFLNFINSLFEIRKLLSNSRRHCVLFFVFTRHTFKLNPVPSLPVVHHFTSTFPVSTVSITMSLNMTEILKLLLKFCFIICFSISADLVVIYFLFRSCISTLQGPYLLPTTTALLAGTTGTGNSVSKLTYTCKCILCENLKLTLAHSTIQRLGRDHEKWRKAVAISGWCSFQQSATHSWPRLSHLSLGALSNRPCLAASYRSP